MKQKYFKCKLSECDCEVEEPDFLCEKCSVEIRADQCAETGKHEVVTKGHHLKVCANVKNCGLDLEHKEIIDSIKKKK